MVKKGRVCVAVLVVVLCTAAASAGTLTISDPGYRTGSGGEFKITGWDDALVAGISAVTNGTDTFHTFCLEKSETIALPGTYNYTIDPSAILGGAGGNGSWDPLSSATAMLFYTYWTNQWSVATSVSGYTGPALSFRYSDTSGGSSSNRALDGQNLQYAIWKLEGEITGALSGTAADYYDYAVAIAASGSGWSTLGRSGWTGIGEVRVANLFKADGTPKQSQLVVVPLPPSALMGFIALGGLAAASSIRRRYFRR
jgi:hypothetical protein